MFNRHALVLFPDRSLRLAVAWVALVGPICPVADAAQTEGIPAGATVYIGMGPDFGADIQAELARQKVALKVVSSAADNAKEQRKAASQVVEKLKKAVRPVRE